MTDNQPPALDPEAWHLDKRVPIATLLAILAQGITFGWFAATMSARVDALEQYAGELRDSRIRERMAVVESIATGTEKKFTHLDEQLNRLEDKLDKIADRVGAKREP